MQTRTLRALLPALALAGLAAACGNSDAASAPAPPVSGDSVTLRDNVFEPPALQVASGTTVTWTWDDGPVQHNVTFDDFGSETKNSGTWTHTFTEPGTYEYTCTLHGGMDGTIVVA
jgi:plastocyanin